jgi:hypothetical protein
MRRTMDPRWRTDMDEARKAFAHATELEPSNQSYRQNLQNAEMDLRER